jgi:hypothetical protein
MDLSHNHSRIRHVLEYLGTKNNIESAVLERHLFSTTYNVHQRSPDHVNCYIASQPSLEKGAVGLNPPTYIQNIDSISVQARNPSLKYLTPFPEHKPVGICQRRIKPFSPSLTNRF